MKAFLCHTREQEALDDVCERPARFDDDTSWAEELLAADVVLDELDKRACLQEKASAATRSSARTFFQDDLYTVDKKGTKKETGQ